MKSQLALQLWSVKKAFMADYKATLKRVAELGFKGVEFAGFNQLGQEELAIIEKEGIKAMFSMDKSKFIPIPAEDLKACLDENGLVACGTHTAEDLILNDLDNVIEYNKKIGNNYVICPMSKVDDKEQLLELIEKFSVVSKKLRENGMYLGYHNHAHEFIEYDGEFALDMIFTRIPELAPEIDTYWVFNAGHDFVEYCKKYEGKVISLHLKDGTKTEDTAVGEGEVDIQAVLDLANDIGAKWLVMEDESIGREEFDSVTVGMDNLKNRYKYI